MNLDAIPPLEKLGIELKHCNGVTAAFFLPYDGNQNDKNTVFAGSQYSALVIAGWYLVGVWAEQNSLGDKVAIKEGNVSYPKAAHSDVTVTARFDETPNKRPSGHYKSIVRIEARDEDGDLVSQLIADYRILL
ncbi:YiiD C-terminal domain-containing protein [Marinomonas balearica]|uniref:Thioesterase domain-containing protein n=1 Tax=Marinomonas balearica TaxID=491947 RepID=A0A4R6MD19_9GAMM|nr:YiiD C-terminal domain-containing protein [Marinomonas balearica]TDO99578.1 thioesterase domain-containing protein [Marinomonas balearica]